LRCSNAALEEEATKLIDDRGAMANEPAADPMQGLKIELLGALDWHKPHGRPLHRLCNGLGVAILLPFPEGLHVLSWDQPDVMADGRQSTANMMCAGTGFDAHETGLQVRQVLLQSHSRQLLAHDHLPTRIHSNEVKATLSEIYADCYDTVVMRCNISHGLAHQLRFCSTAIHSVEVRPVHTIMWRDGSEFRLNEPKETAVAARPPPGRS
jgi:hypothetical protein